MILMILVLALKSGGGWCRGVGELPVLHVIPVINAAGFEVAYQLKLQTNIWPYEGI
jgi:hypothetical protein